MTTAANVIIIGAGIAGAAAASELAVDRRVIILEREDQPGNHATGRSAAITSSTSGDPSVCALAEASRPFLADPPAGMFDRPLLSPRGLMWVADDDHLEMLDQLEQTAHRLGVRIERLTVSSSRERIPTLAEPWAANALLEPDAMSIDVALLLSGLLQHARHLGARLHCRADVLSGQRTSESWVIETTAGSFEAPVVVNASGAWGDEVAIACGVEPLGLQPFRRTAYTFPVAGVEDWPLVMDVGASFYFEPEGPGLLVSPSEETPVPPHDATPDDLAISRSVDSLAEVLGIDVRGVRSRWAGLRTFAPDRRPVIGPDDRQPGFHWLVGQGGAGIKTAPAIARLIRSFIDDVQPPADLVELLPDYYELSVKRFRDQIT